MSATRPRKHRHKTDSSADAPEKPSPEVPSGYEPDDPHAAQRLLEPERTREEAPLAETEADDIAPLVGANLRRLRVRRGLSLERLSRASGVSRAMIGQVELGHSAPTVNVMWKISKALGVPFSALLTSRVPSSMQVLEAEQAKWLTSHGSQFRSRALFPFGVPRRFEFYEMRLSPLGMERAEAHPPGTMENLVVAVGTLEVTVGSERRLLTTGDAVLFEADVPHAYRNPAETEVVMYLVMTYAEIVG